MSSFHRYQIPLLRSFPIKRKKGKKRKGPKAEKANMNHHHFCCVIVGTSGRFPGLKA
jgi:hypothetical protein